MKRYLEGLGFGMLLQLAIGPVCLLVFGTAETSGMTAACSLVLAVGLVDGLYIVLAAGGAGRLRGQGKQRRPLRLAGACVVLLFGADILLGLFGVHLLPVLPAETAGRGLFLRGLLLTLSNPLTIVFWGGVFTSRLGEERFSRRELTAFSLGCLSATFIFLTAVAAAGSILHRFIPAWLTELLNGAVGLLIVFFGVRMLCRAITDQGRQQA